MSDLKTQLSAYFDEVVERVDLEDVVAPESVDLQPPRRRIRPAWAFGLGTAAVVILLGVISFWAFPREPSAPTPTDTPPATSPESTESTPHPDPNQTAPDSPEGSRVWAGTWTTAESTLASNETLPRVFTIGDDVLVIHEQNRGTTVEGEIYDPDSGVATRIASSGLVWRSNAAMAWTGGELLIVGGANGPGIEQIGAAYSPSTDSWRPLPDPPVPVDAGEDAITGPAVWTGTEMVIHSRGLAFDPSADEWREIPPMPGPRRQTEVAIWTGDQLVVWGGCDAAELQCDDLATGILTDGYSYDPATEEWRPIAASPLAPGVHPRGEWTGEEVLMYAGAVAEGDGSTAAAYDPTTDTWRTIPDPPLSPRRYATSTWTGQYAVLWGGEGIGSGSGVEYDDGAAFDPSTNTWLAVPETPGFDERSRHAMVWVQDQIYVTGGSETTGPLTFRPQAND